MAALTGIIYHACKDCILVHKVWLEFQTQYLLLICFQSLWAKRKKTSAEIKPLILHLASQCKLYHWNVASINIISFPKVDSNILDRNFLTWFSPLFSTAEYSLATLQSNLGPTTIFPPGMGAHFAVVEHNLYVTSVLPDVPIDILCFAWLSVSGRSGVSCTSLEVSQWSQRCRHKQSAVCLGLRHTFS